jgi:CRISPR/Cas system-associated endoribonuclease Cas2
MGMEALLALQDVGGPLERKRRAVRRAGVILDELERLKISLLEGEVTRSDLDRLARAVREARERTDDPKLEDVLEEVELRAAVELAKLEHANRAA